MFHHSKWTFWTRTPIESLQTAVAICVIFRPSSRVGLPRLGLPAVRLILFTRCLTYQTTRFLRVHQFDDHIGGDRPRRPPARGPARRGLALGVVRTGCTGSGADPALPRRAAQAQLGLLQHVFEFARWTTRCTVRNWLQRVLRRELFLRASLARNFVIGSTLTLEAAIPLLLVFRRTPIAGAALENAFHYLLGVNTYHDFSGMILGLYLLFLPSTFAERVVIWWKGLRLRGPLTTVAGRMLVPAGFWGTAIVVGL